MATNYWLGQAAAVAQVWEGTITTTTTGHTYTATLTDVDDTSTTYVFSYALTASDTTTTLAAASWAAAWNTSNHPLVNRITATSDAAVVTLTADTAGQPFNVSATGGTGTWSGTGNTTASSGPNDYGLAANWSLQAVPTTGDDVVIPAGSPAIYYNLDQASVAIDDFVADDGSGVIGRFDGTKLYYLLIDPNSCTLRGSGSLVAVDIGSAAIPIVVDHAGSPSGTGKSVVYVRGSAITEVTGTGNVGIAAWPEDTATLSSGFRSVSGTWVIGRPEGGVTVSGATATNAGATVKSYAPWVTVRNDAGIFRQQVTPGGSATYTANGGTMYLNFSGTLATLVANNDAVVSDAEDRRAKTVTNATVRGTATVPRGGSITYTNLPDESATTKTPSYG